MSKIYPQKRNGQVIGYILDLGKTARSNRDRPFFKTEEEARAVQALHQVDPDNTEVWRAHKNEFLRAKEKVDAYGGSIEEAVDFWIRHGARKGNPAISAIIEQWAEEKQEDGNKWSYIDATKKHYSKFEQYVGADTKIGDITTEKVRDFVFKEYSHVNAVTKNNVMRNLSVLFCFAIKKKFLGLNPLDDIDRLDAGNKKPSIITPEDLQKLLDRCLAKQWHDRLTVFVLVAFCGIRTEEACHLQWKHINFTDKTVEVPHAIAKKNSWRTNDIPENAMAWLNAVRDDRLSEQRIIGDNFVSLLRTAVKFAHINHTKNCLRHSFASYAIAHKGKDKVAEVVADMGHRGSSTVFYSNYRNVINDKVAVAKYWNIKPTKKPPV
jgi:integrase